MGRKLYCCGYSREYYSRGSPCGQYPWYQKRDSGFEGSIRKIPFDYSGLHWCRLSRYILERCEKRIGIGGWYNGEEWQQKLANFAKTLGCGTYICMARQLPQTIKKLWISKLSWGSIYLNFPYSYFAQEIVENYVKTGF